MNSRPWDSAPQGYPCRRFLLREHILDRVIVFRQQVREVLAFHELQAVGLGPRATHAVELDALEDGFHLRQVQLSLS